MIKYMVLNEEQVCGQGETLEDAVEDLKSLSYCSTVDEMTYYEVKQIEVEWKVQKKEVPIVKKGKSSGQG